MMNTAHRTASRAKRNATPINHYAVAMHMLRHFSPYTPSQLEAKKKPIRDSFDAIKNGRGTEVDFENLDIAMATSLERSRSIDALCVITATVARDALERCWIRYQRMGRFGFDGLGLTAVQDGIELHEMLLDKCTPKELMEAARMGSRIGHAPKSTNLST